MVGSRSSDVSFSVRMKSGAMRGSCMVQCVLVDASRPASQLLIAVVLGLQDAKMHFISTPAAANKVTP